MHHLFALSCDELCLADSSNWTWQIMALDVHYYTSLLIACMEVSICILPTMPIQMQTHAGNLVDAQQS